MVDPMSDILRTFCSTILDITECDSDGLSLLSKGGGKRFYRPAIVRRMEATRAWRDAA